MTGIDLIALVGVSHFVGDFLFQSNWMALNKSKSTAVGLAALWTHAAIYSMCFIWLGPLFALVTMALHFATDFITSRITSALWFVTPELVSDGPYAVPELKFDDAKRHWFFVVIGFDQLLHLLMLIYTLRFLP